MTAEIAGKIKWLLKATPLKHSEIAALLGGINQGRVSEVKNGKSFSDVPELSMGRHEVQNRLKQLLHTATKLEASR